jgi:hypothetical protein
MIDPITFDFDTLQTYEQNDFEVEKGGRKLNYGVFLIGMACLVLSLKLISDVLKDKPTSKKRVQENY